MRNSGIKLGGDNDSSSQVRIDLHDDAARGGVAPVAAILEAENDELLVLHFSTDERLDGTGLGLQGPVFAARSGGNEAWSVDDGEIGTVFVLDFDSDFLGRELTSVMLQPCIFSFNISLDLVEGFLERERRVGVGDEVAVRGVALGVVFHVEGDGAAGFGAAADVVELEAHEGFDEGAFAVGLVADDQDGGGFEGSVQVLSQGVEFIIGFVETPLTLFLLFFFFFHFQLLFFLLPHHTHSLTHEIASFLLAT